MAGEQTSKIGAFTVGKARLSKHGDAEYNDGGSVKSVADTYTVVMPDGETQAKPTNVSDLPALGDANARFTSLHCAGYLFKQRGTNSRVWDIEVEYTLSEGSESLEQSDGRITALSWSTPTRQKDLTTDQKTGKAIVNSAGDTFDTVPQTDIPDIQLSITRKEKELKFDRLKQSGTINKTKVKICGFDFPPHTALCNVVYEDTLDEEADYRYSATYTITFRRNYVDCEWVEGQEEAEEDDTVGLRNIGWDFALADCGFNILDNDGKLCKIVIEDEDGGKTEPSLPVFLDGAGHRLAEGAEPKFYRVAAYPETEFANFGLPTKAKISI